MSKVYKIFSDEVEKYYRKKSGAVRARGGSICVIQRFSSDLSVNVHYHLIAADGVFVPKTTGREKFNHAGAITDEEVSSLANVVARRAIKVFVKLGYLIEESFSDEHTCDKLFEEAPWLAENCKASTRYQIAHGPRAGQLVRKLGYQTGTDTQVDHSDKGPRCSESKGFSVHANSVAREKESIRKLASYVSRPALSNERLKETDDGELLYEFKRAWKNGCTAVKLAPFELIERLCALIPPVYSHQTRWAGAYGPAARNRNKVTIERAQPEKKGNSDPNTKKARIPWASLLKKIFRIDLTKCMDCGKPVRLIGTVFGKSAVTKILKHLKKSCDPPERGHGKNGWGAPILEPVHPYSPNGQFSDSQFSEFGV